MNRKFSELLKPSAELSVVEQQCFARREFPRIVASSHLDLWKPGDAIASTGRRILMGIASYSRPDLAMLDEIESVLAERASVFQVDIFDILDCSTMTDMQKYVPGIGDVYQTPVVGVWTDAKLSKYASGYPAREMVNELFNLRAAKGDK
jgi:hypothetical protein